MQLVAPIDIEDALRIDLAAKLDGISVFAPPKPDDIGPDSVMVTNVGGTAQTEVSNEHDVSIDCWAATEAEAVDLACRVAGIVATLPIQTTQTHYKNANLNALPYINPDPTRPLLPRATFRATVSVRGRALF